ncbi:MAG: glycosyltransferase family 39 protein [Candidatus Omnitrophota bacterium]
MKKYLKTWSKSLPELLFSIIFLAGIIFRLLMLLKYKNVPLTFDAKGYYDMAVNMTNFYAASFREPFYILIVKMFVKLTGLGEFAVRIQSFTFSVFSILILYLLGLRLFNRFVGICSAVFLSLNPFLIYNCTRGLRTEITIFLLLIFTFIAFPLNFLCNNAKLIILTFIAAALSLIKIYYLPIMILLIFYIFFKEKCPAWFLKTMIAFIVVILLVMPFLISNKNTYNDMFCISNMNAVFWRNQEFAGKPGFPTIAEVKKNPYIGPKITTFDYLFKLHSIREVIMRFIQGYYFCIFKYIYQTMWIFSPLVYFGMIGIIAMLFTDKRLFVLLMLIVILPNVFILPINTIGYIRVDRRFAMVMYPFFSICISYGIYFVFTKIKNFRDSNAKLKA